MIGEKKFFFSSKTFHGQGDMSENKFYVFSDDMKIESSLREALQEVDRHVVEKSAYPFDMFLKGKPIAEDFLAVVAAAVVQSYEHYCAKSQPQPVLITARMRREHSVENILGALKRIAVEKRD